MLRRTLRLGALGGLLMASSLPVAHAAPGFYFGLGVGSSSAEAVTDATPLIFTIQGGTLPLLPLENVPVRFDSTQTGVAGFAGYRLTPHFAIEIGVADLGTFEADVPALSGERSSLEVVQWHAVGQFSYPVARTLALLLNAGVSFADLDLDGDLVGVRMDDGSIPFEARVNAPRSSEAALMLGAGLRWQALESWSMNLTYNHTDADAYNAGTVGLGFAWSPL